MKAGERAAWRMVYPRWRIKRIAYGVNRSDTLLLWALYPPSSPHPIAYAETFEDALSNFPDLAIRYTNLHLTPRIRS